MFSTLSSLKNKAQSYFRPPGWQAVLGREDLNQRILQYLDLQDVLKCRLLSRMCDKLIMQKLEQSEKICFVIDSDVNENQKSVKKDFKIRSKLIRLKTVSKIEDLQEWLGRVITSEIHEVELIDCLLEWQDILRLIYNFENLESLSIVSRNEQFSALYPMDENESGDCKLIDEKRYKLLRELEDVIAQGLPLDILRQSQRTLKKIYLDSQFVHYSAILLKILPLKYIKIEEFCLHIGSSDETQKDYRSIPHLFTTLSNCLVKNASTLKKLVIDTYPSTTGIERNQRMFFNEFVRSTVPMLKIPLKAVQDVSLNFANPNFEIDENRLKFKRFIQSLDALKYIHIGPVQMKNSLEHHIMAVVPPNVDCSFAGIYMFHSVPRVLVANNFSFSDVSFTLSRIIVPSPLTVSTQEYNFKNYQPNNANFEKTVIYQMLPFMTKLHIHQNLQVVDGNSRLCLQDKEIQLIISKAVYLVSLSLQCNLKLLTDSGLTGLKSEICQSILEQFKTNQDAGIEALKNHTRNPSSKIGLGLSLSRLTRLENLALHNAGETITDASAIAFCGMPAIKNILVTSPKLTEVGLQTIRNNVQGTNLIVEWHS